MTSVLVVDDSPTDLELIATVLSQGGYAVLVAATGEVGMELAASSRPDLVIADILMPTMEGYELVRALRNDPRTAEIPVIFCTATYAVEDVRRLADACGVSDILIKPCQPEEIIRVAGKALGSIHEPHAPLATEAFHREHLRVMNAKLIQKVNQLEAAEKRTAESLTLLETLQSTAPVGFGFVDREFRIRRMNETLAAINGAPLADQLGRRVPDVVPEIWSQIEPVYRHVLETGNAVLNQQVNRTNAAAPEKTRVWLGSYYPVRLNGEIIGIGVIVVDITERQQAEEFRSVVMENMAEGLYVLDREGQLVLMNAAASKMLGWNEEELRGKAMHPIIHSQHADGSPCLEEECELLKARAAGRTIRSLDDAFTRKDGSLLAVAYSAAPLLSGTAVRGAVVVFRDATLEMADRHRLKRELDALIWVGRIRDALDDDHMLLYSQPIIPLTGGQPSEELLLRMSRRKDEIVLPGSFLPIAEKYGLVGEIDRWVVAQAIPLAAGGRRVQVNLSAESVGDPELLSLIKQQLHDTGTDPSNIVFEITETALMHDINAGETFARGLCDMGCSVALDDFGTGFGSFTYLKNLPIHYLKIDIEFVRELISNPANRHVVKAIVSLARGFGHQTIAEGVEDAETLQLLRECGVDFAQGYHIGRPAPVDAVPPIRAPPLGG